MTDEHKLIRDQGRALQAEGLLKSDMLNEAFSTLEKAYIDAWRVTAPADQVAREKLYIAINVLGKVRQHLQSAVNDGKLAAAELTKLTQENERKRRYGIL